MAPAESTSQQKTLFAQLKKATQEGKDFEFPGPKTTAGQKSIEDFFQSVFKKNQLKLSPPFKWQGDVLSVGGIGASTDYNLLSQEWQFDLSGHNGVDLLIQNMGLNLGPFLNKLIMDTLPELELPLYFDPIISKGGGFTEIHLDHKSFEAGLVSLSMDTIFTRVEFTIDGDSDVANIVSKVTYLNSKAANESHYPNSPVLMVHTTEMPDISSFAPLVYPLAKGLGKSDTLFLLADDTNQAYTNPPVSGIQPGVTFCTSLNLEDLSAITPIPKDVFGMVHSAVGAVPLSLSLNVSSPLPEASLKLEMVIDRSFDFFKRDYLKMEKGAVLTFSLDYPPAPLPIQISAGFLAQMMLSIKNPGKDSPTAFDLIDIPFSADVQISANDQGQVSLSASINSDKVYKNPLGIPGLEIQDIGGEVAIKAGKSTDELDIFFEGEFTIGDFNSKTNAGEQHKKLIIGVDVTKDLDPVLLVLDIDKINLKTLFFGLLEKAHLPSFLNDIEFTDVHLFYCRDASATAPDHTVYKQGFGFGACLDLFGYKFGGDLSVQNPQLNAQFSAGSIKGNIYTSAIKLWDDRLVLEKSNRTEYSPPAGFPQGPCLGFETGLTNFEFDFHVGLKIFSMTLEADGNISDTSLSVSTVTKIDDLGQIGFSVGCDLRDLSAHVGIEIDISPKFDIPLKMDGYTLGHIKCDGNNAKLTATGDIKFSATKGKFEASLSGSIAIDGFRESFSFDLGFDLSPEIKDVKDIVEHLLDSIINDAENIFKKLLDGFIEFLKYVEHDLIKGAKSIIDIIRIYSDDLWHFVVNLAKAIEHDIEDFGKAGFDLKMTLDPGDIKLGICGIGGIPEEIHIPEPIDKTVSLCFDFHPKFSFDLLHVRKGDSFPGIDELKSIFKHMGHGKIGDTSSDGPHFDIDNPVFKAEAEVSGGPEVSWEINSEGISIKLGIALQGSFLIELFPDELKKIKVMDEYFPPFYTGIGPETFDISKLINGSLSEL